MAAMKIDNKYLLEVVLIRSYDEIFSLYKGFHLLHWADSGRIKYDTSDGSLIYGNLSSQALHAVRGTFCRDKKFFVIRLSRELAASIKQNNLKTNLELQENWARMPSRKCFEIIISGNEDDLLLFKLSMG